MEIKIAVIGLGYVGLPLARLFSTFPTGNDIPLCNEMPNSEPATAT